MESIGYILIYFYLGKLPWQNLGDCENSDQYTRIMQKKIGTPVDELCRDCPPLFKLYMMNCKSLGFTDEPEYDYLLSLFEDYAFSQ